MNYTAKKIISLALVLTLVGLLGVSVSANTSSHSYEDSAPIEAETHSNGNHKRNAAELSAPIDYLLSQLSATATLDDKEDNDRLIAEQRALLASKKDISTLLRLLNSDALSYTFDRANRETKGENWMIKRPFNPQTSLLTIFVLSSFKKS